MSIKCYQFGQAYYPFSPDMLLERENVVAKTPEGDLEGDLWSSESPKCEWVINRYYESHGYWYYVDARDFDVVGCCD